MEAQSRLRKWWMTVAFCVLIVTQGFVLNSTLSARDDLDKVIADTVSFAQESCQNRQNGRVIVRSIMFQVIAALPPESGTPIYNYVEENYPPIQCPQP